jgi:two-component system cell cycle sensor histidine kinase/response regulator CckA
MIYHLDIAKILESSELPAFLLSRDHIILKANQPFCQFFGISREDVEGRKCYELVHGLSELPDFCSLQGDAYTCPFTGGPGEACQEKPASCPKEPSAELKEAKTAIKGFYSKDFFEPKLKKHLLVTLIPLHDERGEHFGYLHFIEDRTEEKEIGELLKATVDLYPGLFFINDENFNILYASKNLKPLIEKDCPKCHYILYGRTEPCPDCPLLKGQGQEDSIIFSPRLSKYFQRYFQVFRIRSGKTLKLTFYDDVTEIVRLFEENPVAMVITKPDGAVVKANRQARALFEVPEDFEGKYFNAKDLWVNPEERQAFISEVLAKGEVRAYEAELKTLNGKPFYALLSSKVYKQDGDILIYTAFEDITEYLKVKEEAQKFFETLVKLLPIGLAILDEEGRAVFVNSSLAKLTGYEKNELLNERLYDLLTPTPELRERARVAFSKIQKGQSSALAKKPVQTRLKRKDGSEVLIEILFDEMSFFGKRCFLGLVFDITERLILEEEARRAEKTSAVLQIAGGLAHDLNNLLMVIKGHLELLELKLKDALDHDKAKHVKKVKETFDKVSQKVLELFILSGRDLRRFEEIRLDKFIPEWVSFYLQGSEVKAEFSVEEGLKLLMDHAQLLSILQNLALNAKDAMGGKGVLKVSAFAEDDNVVLKFEDTGPGIPAELLSKIFDPGFTTKPHGTGLGLTVVQRVVDLYGGQISVDSQVGKGTTFTIKLPRKPKILPISERTEVKVEEEHAAKRVLILEDEEEVRELLAEVLRERGYEVETFEEGDSAFQAYKFAYEEGRPFEVLLLDLTVPQGKGGVYLIERLKEEELLSGAVKIVLMTGYTPKEVSERARHVRYDAVLYKPFPLEKLFEVMEGGRA